MSKIITRRTCLGCGAKKAKSELIRIIVDLKDKVIIDDNNHLGRGAYLCRDKIEINRNCLEKAIQKKAFNYAFKRKIDTSKIFITTPASGSGYLRPC